MHTLYRRIELIDLIESKLERFTERLVCILIESVCLHVRFSHLTSVCTWHEVVCHGLCWTRPTAAQHNMVDNVLRRIEKLVIGATSTAREALIHPSGTLVHGSLLACRGNRLAEIAKIVLIIRSLLRDESCIGWLS